MMALVPVADDGALPAVRSADLAMLRVALTDVMRKRTVPLICGLLIVAQLAWRGWTLARYSFFADDVFYQMRAHYTPLNWSYLDVRYSGHYMPGLWLVVWVLTRVSALNWTLVAASILVFQAGASLAVLRMLRVALGWRPVVAWLMILYLFSALTLPATVWWAPSLNFMPLQIAIAMAVAAHFENLRGETSGARRVVGRTAATVGWIGFGLLFDMRAGVIPLLLFAIGAVYFGRRRGLRRLWDAWLGNRWLWAACGVLMTVYTALYVTARDIVPHGASVPASTQAVVKFAGYMIGQTFLPGLFGGPWRWYPLASADALVGVPTPALWLTWSLTALVIGASLYYRRHAAWAWGVLFCWVAAADIFPLVAGRLQTGEGLAWSLDARYVTDSVVVFVLILGLAFVGMPGEPYPLRRPMPSATTRSTAVAVAVVGVTASATVSTMSWISNLPSAATVRDYLSAAKAAKPAGDAQIIDSPVPDAVYPNLAKFFGPWGDTAHFIGAMNSRVRDRYVDPASSVMTSPQIFDDSGHLVPAGVQGVGTVLSATSLCPVFAPYGKPLTLTLPNQDYGTEARVGFVADADDATLELTFGATPALVHLPPRQGEKDTFAQVFFPMASRGTSLTVTAAPGRHPGKGVCVTSMEFGAIVPAATALTTRG